MQEKAEKRNPYPLKIEELKCRRHFFMNQTIQSMGKVRANSMENNIQHRCKYCLDMWTIVLEMLL